MPVVVLSEVDNAPRGFGVSRFVLDPEKLASDAIGVGHVWVLNREMSREWIRKVGRRWAVSGGAVRTYNANLRFESDNPFRHPIALVDNIVLWEYERPLDSVIVRSEAGFTEFLLDRLYRELTSHPLKYEETLLYRDAKFTALNSSSSGLDDWKQQIKNWEAQVHQLREQVSESRAEVQSWVGYAADFESENQQLRADTFHLRARIESLTMQIASGRVAVEPTDIPESFDALDLWQQNIAGQAIVSPRALRNAQQSSYKDPPLVYRCLLLLAQEYRDMRIHGGGERRARFEDACRALGVELRGAITESRAGEEGEEYYIQHPLNSAKRIFLRFHLAKGNSRDQRICLRIYFAWDAESRLVLIGWLPSHLDNKLT